MELIFIISGKIDVDPDAEAEAVATICMISTPPEVRVAESKYLLTIVCLGLTRLFKKDRNMHGRVTD